MYKSVLTNTRLIILSFSVICVFFIFFFLFFLAYISIFITEGSSLFDCLFVIDGSRKIGIMKPIFKVFMSAHKLYSNYSFRKKQTVFKKRTKISGKISAEPRSTFRATINVKLKGILNRLKAYPMYISGLIVGDG